MSSVKLICSVFRSSKKDEMYLYVDKKQGIKNLPEALMTVFGEPRHVFDMLLTEDKKLARVEAKQVLADIREKGFSLQMPPADTDSLLESHRLELGLDKHVEKRW
ncbi:hypothetical protein OLMES_3348 [Oleiphilus messinensis]|uniref:YcgL domain-containing protein OLMES_3348 n=1 Tax=Oleiphilus messinensis TaxID=141451 RepID=A0A1Y0IA48_9GAMM|nr:YcgL domain-containing protein [Oleiphilus messinensis]ARU57388.1 hypothetical protein OLMES_3348 [Oleiphilus messinensis]